MRNSGIALLLVLLALITGAWAGSRMANWFGFRVLDESPSAISNTIMVHNVNGQLYALIRSGVSVLLSGTTFTLTWTLPNPDDMLTGVSDNILLWRVDPNVFPSGVSLYRITTGQLGVTGFTVDLEEWSGTTPSFANYLEQNLSVPSGIETVEGSDIDHALVDPNNYVVIDLNNVSETDQLPLELEFVKR